MSSGKLIVISGPSGVGKSTVIHRILGNHPEIMFSVSATTREPRPGEVPGKDYHFISQDEFKELVAREQLLEYNHYASGDYYGTPAEPILQTLSQGGTVLLDVDPNGALQVLERCPEAVLVFIAPPSMAELHRRLNGRGDTKADKVMARLAHARWEIQQARRYRYVLLNDQIDGCVERMEQIIADAPEAEKCLYENNTELYILKEVH